MSVEITFGKLVKKHREKLGLTQKQLAHRVGCAPVTLRKIEYDDLRPSSQIAEALAAALEISSEKRAAFVRFARGQHSLSDVSHLSLDEIKTKVTPADSETTSIAALTAADNPYKGLRAFEESDTELFFGRDTFIQQLIYRLGESGDLARFLAVVGPSGSGKSSVVKAGVIPALKRGALPGSENWVIATMVPGSNPLEELEAALLKIADTAHLKLIELSQADTTGLLSAVNQCLPSDPAIELLIVMEQFEELFTLVHDEKIRDHLLDMLLAAVLDERSRVRIILTLRADFLDRLLNYTDFSELMSQRTEFILPLTEDELEQAIVSPAKRVGLKIEPGVVSAIVHELGDQPGTLPLLQYALTELFDKREGSIVSVAAYQALGGALGVLGRRAEDVFSGFDKASQRTTRQLFLRLVTPGEGVEDTRRRVLRSELESLLSQDNVENLRGSKEIQLILDSFGNSRLLTFDRDPFTNAPTVEIAHEVLIRAWSRLRAWLAESRENLRVQRQVMLAAREWVNAGKDQSFLATGARLVRFESVAVESDLALDHQEREYLNASIAERQWREAKRKARRRRILYLQSLAIGILTFLLVAAVSLSIFAFNQRDEAQVQERIAFSRQLAAQALAEVQEPIGNDEFAALLAIRSLKYQYDAVADAALVEAAGKLPLRVFSHGNEIRHVAISPDDKYVLTGGIDNLVKLWEINTGREVHVFDGPEAELSSVVFSPDGKYVLFASGGDTARLSAVSAGQEVFTFHSKPDEILSAVFSPDGEYILTAGAGATLWDVGTGKRVKSFPNIGSPAVFSQDGQYILGSGDEDHTARIFEAATGEPIHTLSGHSAWIPALAFSPDSKYALTGSTDNTAKLWDVSTGQEVYTIRGHSNSIRSVVFSPDGKYFLTGSGDRTARLWDLANGQEVRRWSGHLHRVWSVDISSDGKYVLSGSQDGSAKLWDFAAGQGRILRGHSGEIYGTAISPDGKYILTSSIDKTAKLWDIGTGQEIRALLGPSLLVYSVTFSPDAKYALTSSEEGVAQLWDIATGQALRTFSGHNGPVYDAAFSPDGSFVLTGGSDATARLWEASTGREVRIFRGHTAEILSVAFSPDGSYAVTAGDDGTAKVWEVDTGHVVKTFEGTDIIFAVAFSPDGKYLLMGNGDSNTQLWNVSTGNEIRTLKGHSNTVYDVAFSQDGKYAVTASADRTAKIWDIATGEELRTLSGHDSAIWSATFSPNGKFILTGSFDGTARLWEVDYRDFVSTVCSRLLRDFTDEERTQAHIKDQEPSCP